MPIERPHIALKTHEADLVSCRQPLIIANYSGRAANHRQSHIEVWNVSQGFQNEPEPFSLEIAQRAEAEP